MPGMAAGRMGTGRRRCGCGGRPGSPGAPRPGRWRGCGGWRRTRPWLMLLPPGSCRVRGRGRCAPGRDLLPAECRADADAILLAAAAGGAELADLAALAEEMRRRTARPDHRWGGRVHRPVAVPGCDVRAVREAGRGPDPAVHRGAGRGAGRPGETGRARGPAVTAAAPSRRAGGGVPAADRFGVRAGPGRAADADPGAYDPGSAPRPGRPRRRGGVGGVAAGRARRRL